MPKPDSSLAADLEADGGDEVDILEAFFESLSRSGRFRLIERGGELHLIEAR